MPTYWTARAVLNKLDLADKPDRYRPRRVDFVLAKGDVLYEHLTSSQPEGRSHHGPCTVQITEWYDGGIDVKVTQTKEEA